jgi:hypothetical protein
MQYDKLYSHKWRENVMAKNSRYDYKQHMAIQNNIHHHKTSTIANKIIR